MGDEFKPTHKHISRLPAPGVGLAAYCLWIRFVIISIFFLCYVIKLSTQRYLYKAGSPFLSSTFCQKVIYRSFKMKYLPRPLIEYEIFGLLVRSISFA